MQIKEERDYRTRDRNALISLALGALIIVLAIWASAGTADGAGGAAVIFGVLGLALVVNGYVFYKRR